MRNLVKRIKRVLKSRELLIKISTSVLIIMLIYALIFLARKHIDSALQNLPIVSSVYSFFKSQAESNTTASVFTVVFLGSLFFISLPTELLFPYFASRHGEIPTALAMFIAVMLAQAINYALGYFLGKKILHIFISRTRKEYGGFFRKHSYVLIILSNIFPLPADMLSAILGTVGYPLKKAMKYTAIGQAVKYVLLILGWGAFSWLYGLFFRLLGVAA